LRKLNATLAKPMSFWYYRNQRAREIDFVLERGGRLSFIECKWQENPGKGDARHIHAVQEDLAKSNSTWRPGSHWVIGTPMATYSLGPGVTAGALRDLPRALDG
jgi:hypothetical protein